MEGIVVPAGKFVMTKIMFVAALLLSLAPTLTHAQDDLFAWEPDAFNMRYTIRIPEN
jgi:hypothetical protein